MSMSDAELAERNAIARALDALIAVMAFEAAREEHEAAERALRQPQPMRETINADWLRKAS